MVQVNPPPLLTKSVKSEVLCVSVLLCESKKKDTQKGKIEFFST